MISLYLCSNSLDTRLPFSAAFFSPLTFGIPTFLLRIVAFLFSAFYASLVLSLRKAAAHTQPLKTSRNNSKAIKVKSSRSGSDGVVKIRVGLRRGGAGGLFGLIWTVGLKRKQTGELLHQFSQHIC